MLYVRAETPFGASAGDGLPAQMMAGRMEVTDMSEKQKQLVEDILAANEKLPIEKQYQLLGVAQGLGMVPGTQEKGNTDNVQ